jgi:diguanylate cyclase (GGDEF)-like protein/PAS domain S-box-containing protein
LSSYQFEAVIVATQQEQRPANSLESVDRFRLIFDTTFQFIGLMDTKGAMLEVNRPALIWVRASHDDVIGKPVWETPWWVNAGEAVLTRLRHSVESAAKGEFVRYDVALASPDGSVHTFDFSLTPITDDTGQVAYLVAEGRDITEQKRLEIALREANEQLQRAQEQARQLAITDELTALHNRRGFFILAEQHRKLGARTATKGLLMFADIDGLKRANDEFGHETGDALIALAAKALTQTLRASDLIARLGGDEFAALASLSSDDSTAAIAERLSSRVEALNREANLPIPLQLSFGMHEFEWADKLDLETRVAQADAAMYAQKRSRKT